MSSTRTPRFITFTSLVATGALGLSTFTGCDRAESQERLAPSTVQGERPANPPAGAPTTNTPKPASDGSAETARAEAARAETGSSSGRAPAVAAPAVASRSAGEAQVPRAGSETPTVKRLVLASRVEQREPVALSGDVPLGEPLVAFLEVTHRGEEPLDLVVTFEHASGQKVGFVELRVPEKSPRFRTWARTQNIRQSGEWQAVVRQKDGAELARQSFTVGSPTDSMPNAS